MACCLSRNGFQNTMHDLQRGLPKVEKIWVRGQAQSMDSSRKAAQVNLKCAVDFLDAILEFLLDS